MVSVPVMVMADHGLGLLRWLVEMMVMRTRRQTALYATGSRLRPITATGAAANSTTRDRRGDHVAIERNATVHLLQEVSVLLFGAMRWSLLRLLRLRLLLGGRCPDRS